jgi:hypothetical protein
VVGFVTLASNNPIQSWVIPIASIIWIGISYICGKEIFKDRVLMRWVIASLLTVIALVGSGFIARQFIDISFDGQAYHGEAILQLHEGWNPLYQLQSTPYTGVHDVWLDGYPKAAWMNQASVMAITDNMNDGKMFNYLYLIAGFLVLCAALLSTQKISLLPALLVSFIANFNIVVLLQLNSFYLDGHIASLLILLVSCCILLKIRPGFVSGGLTVATLILLVNTKLVGVVLAILLCGSYGVYVLITNTIRWRDVLVLLTGGAVGVVIFGFNPFITNALYYQHPLFPVFGPEKIEAYSINLPSNYANANNTQLLLLSPFFATNNNFNPPNDIAELKIPFTFTESEFTVEMRGEGPKIGGYGPLFGGIILLSLLAYGLVTMKNSSLTYDDKDSKDKDIGSILLASHVIILSVFMTGIILGSTNYARLFPHYLAVPVVAILLALVSKRLWLKIFGYVITGLILINTGVSLYFNYQQYYTYVDQINDRIQELQQVEEPIIVQFRSATALRYRLEQNNIEYVLVEEEFECDTIGSWEVFPYSPFDTCVLESYQ